MPSAFYAWLLNQSARTDDVGLLARTAERDQFFPRSVGRLHVLLSYSNRVKDPVLRAQVKVAHREWRRQR